MSLGLPGCDEVVLCISIFVLGHGKFLCEMGIIVQIAAPSTRYASACTPAVPLFFLAMVVVVGFGLFGVSPELLPQVGVAVQIAVPVTVFDTVSTRRS